MMHGTYRAALHLALRFLERRDVARFAVGALNDGYVALTHWLLYGDAYPLIIEELQCLRVAAAEGCWVAMTALLKKLAYDQQGLVIDIPPRNSAFDTAVAVHQSVGHLFSPAVMTRAVARGDLAQIKWLHETTQYTTMEAVRRAAEARRLDILQWLLNHIRTGELVQSWLPYDDSPVDVRAIGWICQTEEQVNFCGLSEAHGFTRRIQNLWDPDARVPDLPLAEPFAAAGDRAAIEKLLKLADAERVVSRFTMVEAAGGGHLDLAQWLHSLSLHEWPLAKAMVEAAGKGQLKVVQWLYQFPEARVPETVSRALEGGHLHVARWLRAQDSPLMSLSEYGFWSAAARSMDLAVYRFLHEEWGMDLDDRTILFMGITGDRPVMEYVVEKLLPPDHDGETLVFDAAKKGTLEALEYLIETKGYWSRKTLRAAVDRPNVGLVIAKWIYKAAQQRAFRLDTPVDTQLDFSDIDVFVVARDASLATALWLVETVPEVSTHSLLGIDAFSPESCTHTSSDVVFSYVKGPRTQDDAAAIDALLVACLTHRPRLCTAIQWLPQWAVRTNSTKGFDLLVRHHHPQLFTQNTRDCIVTFSRRAYFMNTLLAYDASLDSPRVSAWAAKYHLQVPMNPRP